MDCKETASDAQSSVASITFLSPPPIGALSADLSNKLKEHTEHSLARLIKRNKNTRYFSESPILGVFRQALESLGPKEGDDEVRDDILLESYCNTVPLTTYDACEPFVDKFLEDNCQMSDVRDIFCPGLPYHIAISSSTSGKKPKYFPKYNQPGSQPIRWRLSAGKTCFVYSLRSHKVIDVQNKDGGTIEKITVGLGSSGMMRQVIGLDVNKDHFNIRLAGFTTSPVAVSFISDYRSFMLMHALFALADNEIESISTLYTTYFNDMIGYIEDEWNNLIVCIETGKLPDLDGTAHVQEYLQPHFPPRPERAAELRSISSVKEEPGWVLKVWPRLKNIMTVASGVFSILISKVYTYHISAEVKLWSGGFVTSEAIVGSAYGLAEENLFKIWQDEFIECLDIIEEDQSASNLIPPWQVKVGKRYEVVVTTRNGLWPYRLGDVVKVAGFHPIDGTPIVQYVERRSVILHMARTVLTESQIIKAISAVQGTFGLLTEFTVVNDDQSGRPSITYLVEVHGELYPTADEAPVQLRTVLSEIIGCNDEQNVEPPAIKILKPRTFRDYRQWKTGEAKSGVGQVKVPILMVDDTAGQWICDRIERVLGVSACLEGL
ncbi:GH3 auxin-responsive promoter [Scleroderma yunnanense]